MTEVLRRWNELPQQDALVEVLSVCGSRRWAAALAAGRPYADEATLFQSASDIWWSLEAEDWLEAFRCHPRIGESKAEQASAQSSAWSRQEQAKAQDAGAAVKQAIAAGNREYEQRFGFLYIVCATGKTAEEMLGILQRRLGNDAATELREAASQQQQIIEIRLRKWLAQ
ncbi:MAG: 2-oxo-4-hydroxy-4-carboxy-5-ureidoimidazoline decarboxylase [Acidobacteriaceae bacterium]